MRAINPCEGCYQDISGCFETCSSCHGNGFHVSYTMGLGPFGLVPSYIEQPCINCLGEGTIYCVHYGG